MNKHSAQSIHKEKARLCEYLTKSNLKLSSGRETVFHEVMNAHGHFAAEELVKRCHRHQRKVSRATIYRSLRELREAGVIRETAFGEKHLHYEHVYDEQLHHHARCIRCYRMIEFPCRHDDKQYIEFLKKHQFQILGHELHFYGICCKCRIKEN